MTRFLKTLTAALLLLVTVATRDADASKILFVGKQPDHPHGTHMYLHTCNMLAKCLEQVDGVETIVSDGWPADASVLQDVSTVVVYATPAAEFLLDAPHRDQVKALMDRGVGLVTLHWASAVNQDNLDRLGPPWLAITGATWVSNVGLHTGDSPLKKLQPRHPIARGWDEYTINDEYYLNPTIDGASPFLRVTVGEQPVVVAWTFERPTGGRTFGTTLGHFYRNFQQTPFRRMIVNGILWTANIDIPDVGAHVELSETDLALPRPADK